MNKIIYTIRTAYGDYFQLSKEGYVLQYNNGLDKRNASIKELKTWQVTGIRQILPFNRLGRLISLAEAVNISSFVFKNRKPRYTIEDIDHGTTRIHGNWRFHGVREVYLVK